MAHKGRRKNENYQRVGRDYNTIAKQSLPRYTQYNSKIYRRREPLTIYEDRRTWHPAQRYRSASSFSTPFHRLKVTRQVSQNSYTPRVYPGVFSEESIPIGVGFVQPRKVLVCVRRKIRREVLHALRIAGGKGFKKPRYNEYSRVRC